MLQNTPADPPVKPRIVLDTYDEEVDVAYRRTDAALTVHLKRLIREEKAVMTGMVSNSCESCHNIHLTNIKPPFNAQITDR
jgi:nitrate/TMAO reductase-like tetraheme cytochrome c subunit